MGFHAVRVSFAAGALQPVVRLVILPDSVVVLVLHVLRLFIATDCAGVGVLRAVLIEHALTKGMGFHAVRVSFAAGAFHPVVRLVMLSDSVVVLVDNAGKVGDIFIRQREIKELDLINQATKGLPLFSADSKGTIPTQQRSRCFVLTHKHPVHIEGCAAFFIADKCNMNPLIFRHKDIAAVYLTTRIIYPELPIVSILLSDVKPEPSIRRTNNCITTQQDAIPVDPGRDTVIQLICRLLIVHPNGSTRLTNSDK